MRCNAGLDEFAGTIEELLEEEKKSRLYDFLVEEALAKVKGGKLYGFDIDITNPRDVIAALYVMYTNKEVERIRNGELTV